LAIHDPHLMNLSGLILDLSNPKSFLAILIVSATMSNTVLDFDLTTHQGLAAVGATFAIANLIVVAARFYARYRQGGTYGTDDWVMVSAYVSIRKRLHQHPLCSLLT
jgi:threonine/homoserine/homoserine lactone efflux protein